MTKGKKGEGGGKDPATQAFEKGLQLVHAHPLLATLLRHAAVFRHKEFAPPAEAWATVTATGQIRCHPTRRGEPEEWAYVIAHCLLHLGFGHFEHDGGEGLAWNTACCAFVGRFQAALKVGRPPEGMGGLPPITAATEQRLFLELVARGVPPAMQGIGAAGPHPDMTGGPDQTRWGPARGRTWQDVMADGLTQAVAGALETAAGVTAVARPGDKLSAPVRRAREWLIASYPLLGGLAASFTIFEDAAICATMDVQIAAVMPEAREIYLNPAAGLTEPELRFVLAHEIMHAALRHDARCQGRDAYLWNVACDYVINAWLVQMGVGQLPQLGALYDPELSHESAESVYDRIVTDMRRYRKLGTFRGHGQGDMLDPRPGWWARGEGQDLDAFYRRALAQGLRYHEAQGRGLLPAGLVEEINALDMRPIPWDVALARWFDLFFPPPERRRTYARMSRRQAGAPDVPLPRYVPPSEERANGRTFGVVLDTSGSMERKTLAAGLGAIAAYAIAREVPAARVVFCDAAVYDQGYVAPEAIAERVRVVGRGGTVLQPAIDLLDRAKDFPPDGPILIITDGACDVLRVRRAHAYLMPAGTSLPFRPAGPVFRIDAVRG